jgi:hypothetical protein
VIVLQRGAPMLTQRFGRKVKLPSTAAIKHQLLMLMLEDEIMATWPDKSFTPDASPALGNLRRLKASGSSRRESSLDH